jgi:predicted acylesterase/phospholipase RssA
MEINEKFEIIVLSGGGSKGLLTLGALHYYYENGMYNKNDVRIYAGTSIGSVINLLLICGYTPIEIFNEIYKTDNFFDVEDYNNIKGVLTKMGLMSISRFINKVLELVIHKIGYSPTLNELKGITGKTLIVTASNVTKMKCEYYTPDTNPNLKCVDAVKLSCNLPLIFQRIRYRGDFITDGGLMDNFPIKYVDDGKSKILGIVTSGLDFSQDDNFFIGYFFRLVTMPAYANMKVRCDSCKDNTTLVKVNWVSAFQTTLDATKKMNMFLYGFHSSEYKDKTEKLYVPGWTEILHTDFNNVRTEDVIDVDQNICENIYDYDDIDLYLKKCLEDENVILENI